MDLRHLRTFVTVAEQGTVSEASLRLRIAQPALSRQINALEEELGVRLFDRVRRRLVLTGEGEQLLADCCNILSAVGSLSERAQLLRRADAGVLKVAATPQMIDGVFSTFLHRYAERCPNVQIKLTEAVGPAPAFHAGARRSSPWYQLDAGNPGRESSVRKLPAAAASSFLPPCHMSLQLGNAGEVEIGRLAPYPLLLLEPSFVVRSTFDAACRLAGLRPNIFIESRTPHTLLSLAEAGHGVAIVPSVLPTHRYRLRILRITHRRRPLREPLAVLWDKRRVLPRYAEGFCGSLAAHMRDVFPISQPSALERGGTAKRAAARRT